VNLFDQAEAIVSPHGAGLTNLFFSNPGCRVLELFSEGFVDLFLLNLAERKKAEYDYLIFKNAKAAFEDQKGQYEDIFVDYEALKGKMEVFA
jgi:capsular polysaccharide biosynthesis protein